ncbi:hypothetical protein LY76DRAFT_658501 [Colletotrichum caudatum]|nr:hypothetical protein LY76DRAFT_658501 [Colletotrichum caudatum]
MRERWWWWWIRDARPAASATLGDPTSNRYCFERDDEMRLVADVHDAMWAARTGYDRTHAAPRDKGAGGLRWAMCLITEATPVMSLFWRERERGQRTARHGSHGRAA